MSFDVKFIQSEMGYSQDSAWYVSRLKAACDRIEELERIVSAATLEVGKHMCAAEDAEARCARYKEALEAISKMHYQMVAEYPLTPVTVAREALRHEAD